MDGILESDKARLRPPPSFLTRPVGGGSTAAVPTHVKGLGSSQSGATASSPVRVGGGGGGGATAAPLSGIRSNPVNLNGRGAPSPSPVPVVGSPSHQTGGSPSARGSPLVQHRDREYASTPLRFGAKADERAPVSRPTAQEEVRSMPVSYASRASDRQMQQERVGAGAGGGAGGGGGERHRAEEAGQGHDYNEADLQLSRGRVSHQSLDREEPRPARGMSSKRKPVPKSAGRSVLRGKSPGPQDKAPRSKVGGVGVGGRGQGTGAGAGPAGARAGGKRRPTELEQAHQQVEKMRTTIDQQRMDIADLEDRIEQQRGQFEHELQAKHNEAQEALDMMGQEMDDLERQKNEQIQGLEDQVMEQRAATQRAEQEVVAAKEEAEKQKKVMQTRIQSITDEANSRMDEYEGVIQKFQDEVQRLEGVVQQREDTIRSVERERDERYQQYEEYLMVGEKSRAELHNALIEMKGNIRVFARVRPVLEAEAQAKQGDRSTHFRFPEGTDHRVLQVAEVPGHQSVMSGKSEPTKTLPFQFDKVFGPEASQEGVFDEISQLVQSSLDGYKVTIFAYGQTGSGKTFTMEGPSPATEGENTGMIARTVNQIFENCQWKSKQTGFRFKLICSFLEIYNETVCDLLDPKGLTAHGTQAVKHEIRIQDNEAVVANIHEEVVEDKHHVYELLRIANENRSTAGTKMNERASRSHSVFMMKIKGYNEATRQEISGLLNLVDLAGSERLSKSQAEGDRLRETQHINKSLACLGDVIAALAKGDGAHVPFRQSKLTHLLQPSMTNESKTLMFVNLNPVKDHLHESLCSLRFAAKVNACEIGLARRKVKQSKDKDRDN